MELLEAIKSLENAGFEVEQQQVVKNGIKQQAIVIGKGEIRPIVYQLQVERMNEQQLIDLVMSGVHRSINVDTSKIRDREYVLHNVISCVRPQTQDETIAKTYVMGDLEEYYRVGVTDLDDFATYIVNKSMAEHLKIDIAELREAARANTEKTVSIKGVGQLASKELGIDLDIGNEELMYVATAHNGIKGASVMLLENVLSDFCEQHGVKKVTIIPSSTEEVMLFIGDGPNGIDEMIKEVNQTLEPCEVLSDHAYYYER